ncbi:carboxylating nicotinate-nucleotide diphosphorylase [Halobacillus massiliensis]|uniref:carboxylating nicotinate-nucleotide diphosphorylase n=1 Tax=Halobacillus massiliensis TaxID=1926286 RepID=UPI0009E61199|nr:carboxylating nicotinate-nucleotide diphosphorylase [Halobacillus massiliensis]
MNTFLLKEKLNSFFMEDIGSGDVTTEAIFTSADRSKASLVAKSNGIFCGEEVLHTAFRLLDPEADVNMYITDGEKMNKGEVIAEVEGRTSAILNGERVVLNLIQRMSGIASLTAEAVFNLDDPSIKICDTRKTVPGLRIFDKYAVRCGGGSSHRYGLYDAVMIKDNHIAAAGSIKKAVQKVKHSASHMMKIEVETKDKAEVEEAVMAGADVIMFDNSTPEEIKSHKALVPAHILTEASGNITLSNISLYRQSGVDYISLGSLTHSVKAADISLLIETKVPLRKEVLK